MNSGDRQSSADVRGRVGSASRRSPHSTASAGLGRLERVPLRPECERAVEDLREHSQGPPLWRARKAAEARDLFALAEIAPRMTVLALEGETELHALVRLRAPVPCLAPGAAELCVGEEVDLVLSYPEEIMHRPLPGYSLVEIVQPRYVHLPNVAQGPSQRLCLGANAPRGYPLREAVLSSYAALTMQAVTVDERDTAGVMNPEAARWWQANASRIPLTTEPFLGSRTKYDNSDDAGGTA